MERNNVNTSYYLKEKEEELVNALHDYWHGMMIDKANKTWKDKDYVVAIQPKNEEDVKEGYIIGFEDGYRMAAEELNKFIKKDNGGIL